MYLFVYGYYDVDFSFEIITGSSHHYALQNFYEFVGGTAEIDENLFYEMIKHLSFEKAIAVFNKLCSRYKIRKVFSDLNEVWCEGGEG